LENEMMSAKGGMHQGQKGIITSVNGNLPFSTKYEMSKQIGTWRDSNFERSVNKYDEKGRVGSPYKLSQKKPGMLDDVYERREEANLNHPNLKQSPNKNNKIRVKTSDGYAKVKLIGETGQRTFTDPQEALQEQQRNRDLKSSARYFHGPHPADTKVNGYDYKPQVRSEREAREFYRDGIKYYNPDGSRMGADSIGGRDAYGMPGGAGPDLDVPGPYTGSASYASSPVKGGIADRNLAQSASQASLSSGSANLSRLGRTMRRIFRFAATGEFTQNEQFVQCNYK
jgi:hypothetical protein